MLRRVLHEEPELELSVVMPCLDEEDTVGLCVEKALRAIRDLGIVGEVIVADNGSRDASAQLAAARGARVVAVAEHGYGSALMGGIAAARGRFVLMGDADDSYDFLELPKFVAKLREGYDLVQGCRLPAGGGRVVPGAMPPLHRWLGNPMLTLLARWWFGTPLNDIYCGYRGFVRAWAIGLDQRCTGMEFATEMIVRSSLLGARVTEVPITLHLDGRKARGPHLRTFRDGWRTLRFFLMYCPRWLFLAPGFALIALGLAAFAIALPGLTLGPATFGAHTLLFGSLAIVAGYQSILFAAFTKTFAIGEGLLPLDARMERWFRRINLERGLLAGAATVVAGVILLLVAVARWRSVGFGALDYVTTMRIVVPGVTLTILGYQTLLSSFFLSILGLRRR